MNFLDRKLKLATTPVFLAVYDTTGIYDHAAITLGHRRHLLTLVRVDQKHDFVMLHISPFGINAPRYGGLWSKESSQFNNRD
jgi:hypothetical protein